jgi:glycosyltransferase involved in cell wall biosynthesis
MFSIITPTFNRQNTLHRVYDSLLSQSYKEFHWIIVDDASEDGTEQMVNGWIEEETNFDIQYHKLPENKGKPFALNYGFTFCSQPITIIADSDDSFEPCTLSDLKELWDCVDNSIDGKNICTIWTLVKDEQGNIVGDKFPRNFWQVDFKERVLKRKKQVSGEKWHSWRSDVLQQYGMFHNDNTKYIGESATWEKINQEYDFLCVNMVHRIYWHSDDGLMQQKKSKLKIAKTNYYTSYFQLKRIPPGHILQFRYYRRLAFEYLKSSRYYTDKAVHLDGSKLLLSVIAFLMVLPNRILAKL